jgi:glycosyltransferase involved in cell wall biosynthesis
MRPRIKAFVSQACLHGFVVLLWVTLEDDVGPLKAVVKRSYQWSKFYNARPCICHYPLLRLRTIFLPGRTIGSFRWLKELKSMKEHKDCRMNQIIVSKSLPRFVVLRGEANQTNVLVKSWVFLYSSISEGLAFALGKAALTGTPLVCTDVGASLLVLTDADNGAIYSAVVAPNDARNLARAQINFLALLDEWIPYANDPESFVAHTISDKSTIEDIAQITQRMYANSEERKAIDLYMGVYVRCV